MERRKLVAGNWKMNGTSAHLPEIQAIGGGASEVMLEEIAKRFGTAIAD